MLKNSLFMLLTTSVRFLTGGLLFIVLARAWSPENFGLFIYYFTLSSLIVLAIDYGFQLQLVRDIGQQPKHLTKLFIRALATKVLLFSVSLLTCLAIYTQLEYSLEKQLFLTLFLANTANSFAVFFHLPLRGLELFKVETHISLPFHIFHFSLICLLLYSGWGPLSIALGFLISKVLYAIGALWQLKKYLRTPLYYPTANEVLNTLISGWPYGIHTALGTLYAQVDTLFIKHYLDIQKVGEYQAAMRLFFAGLIISEALSATYFVRMSQNIDNSTLSTITKTMLRHFIGIGIILFSILSILNDVTINVIFGNNYPNLYSLIPWFGLALFLRYLLQPFANLLTIMKQQSIRAAVSMLALLTSIVLNMLLIPTYKITGAILSLVITTMVIGIIYALSCRKLLTGNLISPKTWFSMSLGFAFNLGVPHTIPVSIRIFITLGVLTLHFFLITTNLERQWIYSKFKFGNPRL